MQLFALDQLIEPEHRVRTVWQFVDSLDLTELYTPIKATEGNAGRDAIDPRILFALWLFATIEGVTSARKLDELTRRDTRYMWICGGVSVNYHRLSEFRSQHGDLLERILTDAIAALLHNGLVTLETIGQDGMRVRANAGSGSFRTAAGLEEARKQAQQHMDELKKSREEDPSAVSRRQASAQERAAREKLERIENAQEQMKEMQEKYEARNKTSGQKRSAPRASTTDPDARRMKMGDNGFRPALNVQFASDGDNQLIVGVDVTNQGSDTGLMKPMYDKVCGTYDVIPKNVLVDGGFVKKEDFIALETAGTQVHAPICNEAKQLADGKDPYAPRKGEGQEMTNYRQRMGTPEGKAMYRRRSAIAEYPNAECRNRGLNQFPVRGLVKAKAQALWHALAFNFNRLRRLHCEERDQSYLEIVMGH